MMILNYVKFTTAVDHRNALVKHNEAIQQLKELKVPDLDRIALFKFGENFIKINKNGFYIENPNREMIGEYFLELYDTYSMIFIMAFPKEKYNIDYEYLAEIFKLNKNRYYERGNF